MKSVNRLLIACALTLLVGVSVAAAENSASPCAPPDPGEMNAPPCSTAQSTSDDPTLGETSAPPSASVAAQYVVADKAIDFVEGVLSLF